MQLYTLEGARKYLTAAKRDAFLAVADRADRDIQTLCMTLAYTGCRLSGSWPTTYASCRPGAAVAPGYVPGRA